MSIPKEEWRPGDILKIVRIASDMRSPFTGRRAQVGEYVTFKGLNHSPAWGGDFSGRVSVMVVEHPYTTGVDQGVDQGWMADRFEFICRGEGRREGADYQGPNDVDLQVEARP